MAKRFYLLAAAIAVLALIFNPWVGLAYAEDMCDPDLPGCAIENQSITVERGESLNINKALYVGYGDLGTLSVVDGGVVSANNYLQIGFLEESDGLVEVSGLNSKLDVGIDLNVGISGEGELIITDRASVDVDQHVQIGLNGEGNSGTATVTKDAKLNIANGNLIVGKDENSNGSLIISEGGTVTLSSGDASIAIYEDSKGVIYIGAVSGDAAEDPGFLEFEGAGDGIAFGQGDGYLVFNHTDNNYKFDPKFWGGGTIQVENGKTVLKGNNSNFTGNINLFGGTLSVGDKSNLGADSATLNFNGGTLHVDADNFGTTAQNINIGPNHAELDMDFNSDIDQSMILAGNITGSGDLIKLGRGSLELTGKNNYGNTFVEKGELIGNADSISGNVFIADEDTAAITFHQNNNASFAGNITSSSSNMIAASKTGAGTLRFLGQSNSGWSIEEGTLSVGDNAVLGGKVIVDNGAVLAGTGTAGTANTGHVTVGPGGTIAPGNSIGTLNVAGNLIFTPGSRYEVEVAPNGSASDRIKVGGTATLAGSVVHVGLDGEYRPRSTYNILTADKGLIGKFDSASSDFAFLTPVLGYDNNNVNLTLMRNQVKFTDLAITKNQRATAGGLASLPANSKLLQKVELLPKGTPSSTFDKLSGEIHAGLISALGQNTIRARTYALSSLRSNLGAGYRPGAPLAQASNLSVPTGAMPSSAALPMWAQVIGSRQSMNGNENAADLKQNTYGVFAGGDFPVGHGWRLGGSFGYTNSKIHMDERSSRADIDSYTASLYGGKSFATESGNSINLLMGGSYSWHKINTRRDAYLNDWSHKLKSNYKANTSQLFGEVSYAMRFGNTQLEPFAGLSWTSLSVNRFSESGGPTALSAKRQTQNNTNTVLGLRTKTEFDLGQSTAFVQASLAWQHTFGRIDPVRSMAFVGGKNFTITGTPMARDSALVGVGAGFNLSKKAVLGVSYSGQFGGGNTDHGGSINLNWQF